MKKSLAALFCSLLLLSTPASQGRDQDALGRTVNPGSLTYQQRKCVTSMLDLPTRQVDSETLDSFDAMRTSSNRFLDMGINRHLPAYTAALEGAAIQACLQRPANNAAFSRQAAQAALRYRQSIQNTLMSEEIMGIAAHEAATEENIMRTAVDEIMSQIGQEKFESLQTTAAAAIPADGAMAEYTAALIKAAVGSFVGPAEGEVVSVPAKNDAFLAPGGAPAADWSASRTSCCASTPLEFQESTEALQESLSQVAQEIALLNNNIATLGGGDSMLQNHRHRVDEVFSGHHYTILSDYNRRRARVRAAIYQAESYPGSYRRSGGSEQCSTTGDAMLSNLPLANKWIRATFNTPTVHTTRRPFLNPKLIDGDALPQDDFEKWLLANPTFYPHNLWQLFLTPQIGSYDTYRIRLLSLGDYNLDVPARGPQRAIDRSNSDRAPIFKSQSPSSAAALHATHLSYEPVAHASNYLTNMLLDDVTLPPTLNPQLEKNENVFNLKFITGLRHTYTSGVETSSAKMPLDQWREWIKTRRNRRNSVFARNFAAEATIREVQSSTLKSVIAAYMIDNYRMFPAPENTTARDAVLKGFVDYFLPPGQQGRNEFFSKVSVDQDEVTRQWIADLGLQIEGAYTAAQKRDLTVMMLAHPVMLETVTRAHSDDLERLLIKYMATQSYLRKLRLDELKKQRLLLTVIAENGGDLEKIADAAAARTGK